MKITVANKDDAHKIMTFLDAVKLHMYAQNIDQWSDIYPNQKIVAADIKQASLYLLQGNDQIAGIVTLNEYQDPEYLDIDWADQAGPVLVVHRLAVHPDFQGQGCATRLMNFSEALAKEKNYRSIRLDAYSHNPTALSLYEKRGYTQRGTIWFPGRKFYFFVYEKDLS